MKADSTYHATCHLCGAEIVSPTPEATCSCGLVVLLEWREVLAASPDKALRVVA